MDSELQNPRPEDIDTLVDALLDAIDRITAERDAALAEVKGVRHALISMQDTMAFSARDWSVGEDVAWLWGIVCGWPDGAMREMRERYTWLEEQRGRLRGLHASVKAVLGPDAVDADTPEVDHG